VLTANTAHRPGRTFGQATSGSYFADRRDTEDSYWQSPTAFDIPPEIIKEPAEDIPLFGRKILIESHR
jgi:hypothetical protein